MSLPTPPQAAEVARCASLFGIQFNYTASDTLTSDDEATVASYLEAEAQIGQIKAGLRGAVANGPTPARIEFIRKNVPFARWLGEQGATFASANAALDYAGNSDHQRRVNPNPVTFARMAAKFCDKDHLNIPPSAFSFVGRPEAAAKAKSSGVPDWAKDWLAGQSAAAASAPPAPPAALTAHTVQAPPAPPAPPAALTADKAVELALLLKAQGLSDEAVKAAVALLK